MDSMVHSDTPEPAGADQSLGDLVALAAKDVSQLIRYEIDLAKSELKVDAQRVGIAAAGSQPLHIRRTRSLPPFGAPFNAGQVGSGSAEPSVLE
jgi:hypothetical protein